MTDDGYVLVEDTTVSGYNKTKGTGTSNLYCIYDPNWCGKPTELTFGSPSSPFIKLGPNLPKIVVADNADIKDAFGIGSSFTTEKGFLSFGYSSQHDGTHVQPGIDIFKTLSGKIVFFSNDTLSPPYEIGSFHSLAGYNSWGAGNNEYLKGVCYFLLSDGALIAYFNGKSTSMTAGLNLNDGDGAYVEFINPDDRYGTPIDPPVDSFYRPPMVLNVPDYMNLIVYTFSMYLKDNAYYAYITRDVKDAKEIQLIKFYSLQALSNVHLIKYQEKEGYFCLQTIISGSECFRTRKNNIQRW